MTTTEQATVARTAIRNVCHVSGTKLVSAIMTNTWLKPCSPILVSTVGSLIRIDNAAPIPDPMSAITPPR